MSQAAEPRQRPRHPDKDLEQLMREAEAHGWTYRIGRKCHFIGHCPCGEHFSYLPGSPGDHRTVRNERAVLRRCPRWPR